MPTFVKARLGTFWRIAIIFVFREIIPNPIIGYVRADDLEERLGVEDGLFGVVDDPKAFMIKSHYQVLFVGGQALMIEFAIP
jgi:hypothetical protein